MTPKEKAKELLNKMYKYPYVQETEAKRCALIAVNELIHCTPSVNGRPFNCQDIDEYCCEYWQKIKQELEKL